MGNFEDMFERLSSESEQRKRDREEKERREREESDAAFERDRIALVEKVMPLLEDAKRQFEAKGVPVIIEDNWSGLGRGMTPRIEFRCEKDYQPNSIGGQYKPHGRSAFFSVSSCSLEVGLGKYAGQRVRDELLKGEDDEIIQRAIEIALQSYFQSIEEGERPR